MLRKYCIEGSFEYYLNFELSAMTHELESYGTGYGLYGSSKHITHQPRVNRNTVWRRRMNYITTSSRIS